MTSPRPHPLARTVSGARVTYVCGCVNETHAPSGVLRSVSKCKAHKAQQRDPATLGEAYYRELGALDADAPARYVGELTEALGEFPTMDGPALALEIGCGASPYVSGITFAGYGYVGLDSSAWACDWVTRNHDVAAAVGTFEATPLETGGFDLVLAAHSLEHLDDAPAGIRKCADLLAPGGELWVVVPDDSDPCNPDHLFTFDQTTLRYCIEASGLIVERMTMRKKVAHENFIYCRARKPG